MSAYPYQWSPGNSTNMRKVLEMNPWGYQSTSGTTTALFCPMCMAMVAPGTDGYTPRLQHIDWHVAAAEAIEALSPKGAPQIHLTDDGVKVVRES